MSARRTILLGFAVALSIAALCWLVVRRPAAPGPDVELGAVQQGEVDGTRTSVAEPADADPAPSPEPARGTALTSGGGLDAGAIDEFTIDGLREGPKPRARTLATGRVVDDAGKPLAGAEVLASLNETRAGAALDADVNIQWVRHAESGADGRFLLANLDPGKLRVAVRAKAFAPLDLRELSLPPGEKTELGDLRLARGVVLSGRVVDGTGMPVRTLISRVSATLLGPVHRLGSYVASPLGASGEDGFFELPCVSPGRCTLLLRCLDFPETSFEVEAPADLSRVDGLELVLQRGAEIAGRIRDFDAATMKGISVIAIPEDGSRLFGESRPPGANLLWLSGAQGGAVDEFGGFGVRGLAPGRNYALRATREASVGIEADPERPDPWAPFTVVPAGTVDAELVYLPGCRLDFEVVDDSTGERLERFRVRVDGLWPEEPLPRVAHSPPDGESSSRSFFPGGRVSMIDLRAKTLESPADPSDPAPQTCPATLTIEAPGFDTVHMAGLRLEPGSRLDLGMVGLRPMPILEVRVLDAQTAEALAHAGVELRADQPERVAGRTHSATTTDAGGYARLTSLPALASTLSVACAGYAAAEFTAPGEIRSGAPPFEVALLREARVRVIVRDSRGVGAGSVLVSIQRQAMPDRMVWQDSAMTDASGLAFFAGMPGGVFDVAARTRAGIPLPADPGNAAASARTLTLQAGDEQNVSLEIQALSSLSGTIWFGREPLSRAQISIESGPRGFRDLGTDLSSFSTPARCFADAQGSFEHVELLPGVYSLLIEQSELSVRTLRAVRVENNATNVIIDIGDTAITGRVVDNRGDPIAGARVQLFADRPGRRQDIRPVSGEFLVPFEDYRRPICETLSDALGVYRIACVPPGIPLEMFFSSGRRARSIPRIHAPQGTTLEGIDASLPDTGGLEVILSAPLPLPGLHYGARIVGLDQPEGLAMLGALFDADNRVRIDELPPGRWVVMVFALNAAEQVVERKQAQTVQLKSGKLTEFSVGW